MLRALSELWDDQDGTTTVEYALLVTLVVVGSIGAWNRLGDIAGNTLDDIENTLQD